MSVTGGWEEHVVWVIYGKYPPITAWTKLPEEERAIVHRRQEGLAGDPVIRQENTRR